MTPKQFIKFRESLGLTPTELAESLGVTYQAIKDWQSGRRNISSQVEKQLECLQKVEELESHNKALQLTAKRGS